MKEQTKGLIFGGFSYILWGILPLFWKSLSHVDSYIVFSVRILSTIVTMGIYVWISGSGKRFKKELTRLWQAKKELGRAILAGFLIACNWLVYIWAVAHGQATEASLGYYIMPLLSVFLATVFLKERLSFLLKVAIVLALIGLAILVLQDGKLPIVSVILAITFSFYGLIKKEIHLSSDVSMLVEALVVAPVAVGILGVKSGQVVVGLDVWTGLCFLLSGVITIVPLLLFSEAVKRAPLSLIGFLQYLNPTIQLALAVLVFGEVVSAGKFQGFSFIWLALACSIMDSIRKQVLIRKISSKKGDSFWKRSWM